MRTVLAIFAAVLLLANLACAAACVGKAPAGKSAAGQTAPSQSAKLPPCHQSHSPTAQPECDHSAPNVDLTGVPATLPPLDDHGIVPSPQAALGGPVLAFTSAGLAASPPVIPLRI